MGKEDVHEQYRSRGCQFAWPEGWRHWLLVSSICCLLSPAAIILSALLAWLYHRRISARRATLKFVAQSEIASPEWRGQRALFGSLASEGGQGLLNLVNPSNQDQIAQAVELAQYLNHCEFVAVAIKQKAMDEKTYKKWQRTAYVKTWEEAQAYVTARRLKRSQPSMYENFEALAKKWRE